MYQVRLPAFDGPLDLLLKLVEQRQLAITEVSLAQVTGPYLQRIATIDAPPHEKSHFLVIASRLILLKSRNLLPQPEQETMELSADDLAEQLRIYQRYRKATELLRSRESYLSYGPLVERKLPVPRPRALSLSAAQLARAYTRAREIQQLHLATGNDVARRKLKLADMVRSAENALRQNGQVALSELVGENASRPEVVVAFLAALDLVRRGRARPVQDRLYGPITLYALEDPS